MMNLNIFTETLQRILVAELQSWRLRFATETMRAFNLGCFPWHGYLELSFLTTNEPRLSSQREKFGEIAAWRWYNFVPRWPQAIEISQWMKEQWTAADDMAAQAEVFLTAASSVAQSTPVLRALAMYRRAEDFEVTVFDSDHPSRGNLVRNARGLVMIDI